MREPSRKLMMIRYPETTEQIESTITDDGLLRLELRKVPILAPRADEVVIRVDATPINPTDIGLMLSSADLSTLDYDYNLTTAHIPAKALGFTKGAYRTVSTTRQRGRGDGRGGRFRCNESCWSSCFTCGSDVCGLSHRPSRGLYTSPCWRYRYRRCRCVHQSPYGVGLYRDNAPRRALCDD